MKDWEGFSKVIITFNDYGEDEECQMTITQTEIPEKANLEYLKNGWFRFIIHPLKLVCGFPLMES